MTFTRWMALFGKGFHGHIVGDCRVGCLGTYGPIVSMVGLGDQASCGSGGPLPHMAHAQHDVLPVGSVAWFPFSSDTQSTPRLVDSGTPRRGIPATREG